MNDEDLTSLIRNQATRFTAGTRLRAEVQTKIALEAAAKPHSAPVLARGWREHVWRIASASFALGVAITITAFRFNPWQPVPGSTLEVASSLEAELVSEHVRSLRVGPLLQVVSTDRHTVKPWFQGKLDYAPPVLNLADEGFSLRGGRVERINGESVAALVYGHNLHIITLFVWPSNARQPQQRTQQKGFNVLHWSNGTMQCWLVTDMDVSEAERFGQLWRDYLAKL